MYIKIKTKKNVCFLNYMCQNYNNKLVNKIAKIRFYIDYKLKKK